MQIACLLISVFLILTPATIYATDNIEGSIAVSPQESGTQSAGEDRDSLGEKIFNPEGAVAKTIKLLEILTIPLIPFSLISGKPISIFFGVKQTEELIKGETLSSVAEGDSHRKGEIGDIHMREPDPLQ